MNDLVPYVDVERMALAIAKSGLFGVKTPDQALALMLVAQAEGLHPATAARDYDIIQGRPAKKSEAMLRAFLTNGGTVKWNKLDDTCADATFSHPQGGEVRIEWDMKRVQKAQISNPAMYGKYPRQMLRSRCISEGIRTVCPMATSGMYVPEELKDDGPQPPAGTVEVITSDKKVSRLETIVDAVAPAVVAPVTAPAPAPVPDKQTAQIAKTFDAKPEPTADNATGRIEGKIEDFKSKEGTKVNGQKWVRWAVKVGGMWFGTFSETHAKKLSELNAKVVPVQVLYTTRIDGDKKFYDVQAVSEVVPATAPVNSAPSSEPTDDDII